MEKFKRAQPQRCYPMSSCQNVTASIPSTLVDSTLAPACDGGSTARGEGQDCLRRRQKIPAKKRCKETVVAPENVAGRRGGTYGARFLGRSLERAGFICRVAQRSGFQTQFAADRHLARKGLAYRGQITKYRATEKQTLRLAQLALRWAFYAGTG